VNPIPVSELEQTAAVMSMLDAAAEPLTPAGIAARFKQGRRVLPQMEAALAAMVRIGSLICSPDGGRSFTGRRAAL
jgi:hypothetical protein